MTKNLFDQLVNRETKLSLIGLGYVGLPIAVAFAKKVGVVGFDLNEEKIALYKQGIDPTREEGDESVRQTTVEFTSDAARLREAKFHIVAVPTPVNSDHTPDLNPLKSASARMKGIGCITVIMLRPPVTLSVTSGTLLTRRLRKKAHRKFTL